MVDHLKKTDNKILFLEYQCVLWFIFSFKNVTVYGHLKVFLLYCIIRISPMGNLGHFSHGKPAVTVTLPSLQCVLGV